MPHTAASLKLKPGQAINTKSRTRPEGVTRSGLCCLAMAASHHTFIRYSERSQEIQKVLLFLRGEVNKVFDCRIGFGSVTPMSHDGALEIRRASVMEKKEPLTQAPKWSSPKLGSRGITLHRDSFLLRLVKSKVVRSSHNCEVG
jgi:hypothetical protein